jgi:hypothetical protein
VMLAFAFAALRAEHRGCHLQLPSEIQALPGWTSKCPFILNKKALSTRAASSVCGTTTFNDYGKNERKSMLMTQHRTTSALRILALYSGSNQSHAYGHSCASTEAVAVHVRSGDLLQGVYDRSGNFHSNAGRIAGTSSRAPFVSAFYAHVIEELLSQSPSIEIGIYFEDADTPTFNYLRRYGRLNNVKVYHSRDLLADVVDMACAKYLVTSRGSFYMATTHRQQMQTVYSLSTSQKSPYRCHLKNSRNYYLRNDSDYGRIVKTKTWKNLPWQRDLLNRPYQLGVTQCTNCLTNASCVV